MTTPFVDQSERDYQREREAGARFEHLKLVRREVAGGEEASEEEVARFLLDFSDATEAANFLVAHFARTEKHFPDTNAVRNLLDALIGASGGSEDWVFLTDEQLSRRMGCSTKTVARVRGELRACPGHTKLLDVRDNWQHPETKESHPHSYRLKIHRLAAETALDARIDPQAGRDRDAAFEASAEVTATAAQGFVARPPKRRKAKSSDELLVADVEAVVRRLEAAAARPTVSGQAAYERLGELHKRLCEALAEFEDAHGFESGVSMHSSKEEERRVDTEPAAPPDEPADDPRMEAENIVFSQVDILSTSEKQHFSDEPPPPDLDAEPDPDLSEWVWMEGGEVQYRFPPPNKSSPELEEAILAQVTRLEGKGARDGTL